MRHVMSQFPHQSGLPWTVLRMIIKTKHNGIPVAGTTPGIIYGPRPTHLERLALAYLQKASTFELARDDIRPKQPKQQQAAPDFFGQQRQKNQNAQQNQQGGGGAGN